VPKCKGRRREARMPPGMQSQVWVNVGSDAIGRENETRIQSPTRGVAHVFCGMRAANGLDLFPDGQLSPSAIKRGTTDFGVHTPIITAISSSSAVAGCKAAK
jgi:hypothetical protein